MNCPGAEEKAGETIQQYAKRLDIPVFAADRHSRRHAGIFHAADNRVEILRKCGIGKVTVRINERRHECCKAVKRHRWRPVRAGSRE